MGNEVSISVAGGMVVTCVTGALVVVTGTTVGVSWGSFVETPERGEPSWSQPDKPSCSNSLSAEHEERSMVITDNISAVIQVLVFFILPVLIGSENQIPFLLKIWFYKFLGKHL